MQIGHLSNEFTNEWILNSIMINSIFHSTYNRINKIVHTFVQNERWIQSFNQVSDLFTPYNIVDWFFELLQDHKTCLFIYRNYKISRHLIDPKCWWNVYNVSVRGMTIFSIHLLKHALLTNMKNSRTIQYFYWMLYLVLDYQTKSFLKSS